MKKLTKSALFLQLKRYKQWLRKANSKLKEKLPPSIIHKREYLEYFRQISPLALDLPKKNKKTGLTLTIPEDFSLLSNPEQVLGIIAQLGHLEKLKVINHIHIDHSAMVNDDLAAEILLGQAVAYNLSIRESKGGKLKVDGKYPEDRDKIRLLNSVGIVKEIKDNTVSCNNNEPEEDLDNSNSEKVKIYKRCGLMHEELDIHMGDQKGRAIIGFQDHINNCLSTIERQLTGDAVQELGEYIGEIIGNAEDHSGTSYWHIYGYLDHTNPEKIYSEVVIYSLGKSISETFLDKRNVDLVFSQVEPYIKLHRKSFSKSVLITVQALQQFVSSKRDEDVTRGQGTIDLLNFFDIISKECVELNGGGVAKLTIISGDVKIDIDGKYLPKVDPSTGKESIYFNEQNSPMFPPDKNYVKQMKNTYFPGTIIAIKFPLKDSALIQSKEKKNV
jgi:hypothetical protein